MTKNLDFEGLKSIADNYDLFYIDLWGVVHNGVKLHDKAVIALKKLLELNKKFVLLTNAPRPNDTVKVILEKMINNPGKTFSREDIGQLIELDKERSIDVIITRLRKKIEINPKNPKFLQTIRGAGYVLWIE